MKTDKISMMKRQLTSFVFVLLGCVLYAFGFQYFLYPNNIVSGGLAGISMIINAQTGWPVGLMIIAMNVPLFIYSWKHFGLNFMVFSLLGTLLSSALVDILAVRQIIATDDPMLAAIIGGVIKGAGLGMVYYTGATTGGVDIVAKLLKQKYSQINFGTIILVIDTAIIALYAFMLGKYESAMYSLIAMYVVSKVIDIALYGTDSSCICYIISSKKNELVQAITTGSLHRGVTLLESTGAYSHEKKEVIFCVVKRIQIGVMRRVVKSIDPNAFFVVSDAKNVFGNGFESISEVK